MWIVQVALKRPYTFVVLALLILVISPLVIDRTPTDIFPNINAQVHLKLAAAAPTLVLPVNALLFRSEGLRVGVVREGNKVDLVPVTIGKDFGTEVEITSGIAADDSVIVSPPDSLASGTVVHVAAQAK